MIRFPKNRASLLFPLAAAAAAVLCLGPDSVSSVVQSLPVGPETGDALAKTARILLAAVFAACAAGCLAWFCVPALRVPHRAFLLCLCLLGPLYVFLFTPFSPPDERFHFEQASGTAVPDVGKRTFETEDWLNGYAQHRNVAAGYLRLGLVPGPDPSGGFGDRETAGTPVKKGNVFHHLSQAAGYGLGRRAGLGPLPRFYLGRLSALAVYALAVFWSIRIAPAFKLCIAAVALCPITLQQACSYSYDNETFACGFLCFSLFLRACAGPEERLSAGFLATAFAVTAVGMAVKCAALPFLPLLFAVPAAKFRHGLRGKAAFLVAVAVASALAASASRSVLPHSVLDVPFGVHPSRGTTWSLRALAADPANTFRLFVRTFDRFGPELFFQSFGSVLSGRTVWLPARMPMVFFLLFLFAVRADRTLPDRVRPVRIASGAGFALLTVSLSLVMLTNWTPSSDGVVQGLQGRYWTPVLPLAAACLAARRAKGPSAGPDADFPLFPFLLLAHCDVLALVLKESLRTW